MPGHHQHCVKLLETLGKVKGVQSQDLVDFLWAVVRVKSWELDKLAVTIPQEVLFQDLGEETVLLNVATGKYHGLNGVGSRIWELIQESNPMGMVLAALLYEFEVPSETLENDLRQFLGVLQSKGLIEVHEADGQ